MIKRIKNNGNIITAEDYNDKLDKIISRTRATIVIRGHSEETFKRFEAQLYKNKTISKLDDPKLKDVKVTKHLFAHTVMTKLDIPIEVFNSMIVNDIYKNEKCNIIVNFKDHSSVVYIYSLI